MKKVVYQVLKFSYFFTCFFCFFTNYAHAYIDPSTVTYIIQGVAGVFIAIGATVTIFRHKIVAAWRKWHYGRIEKKNKKQQINAAKKEKE